MNLKTGGFKMADVVRCSQGHENPAGSNFCKTCGEKISGGQVVCPHCRANNDSGANFCEKCGKPISENKSTDIKGMKWQRGTDDFATRVDVEDLQGILKKGLVVEQGTKALLFINGKVKILQPGKYDLGGISAKLKNFDLTRTATAILVDSGDVELNLNITGIYTKDPLNIDVICKVISQIANPTLFFNNVMHGRGNYSISDIRGSLYDEIQNALNEVIGQKSVTDLNGNLSLKREFEVSVENHLQTTFQRNGLAFIQLRTIDYRFKGFDKVAGIYEEVFLQVSEEEAKLQGRKRLFDVFDKDQIQDIFEETKKAEHYEKRIDVWQRLRQLVNSDKMNEVKSADDLDAYMQEINKGKWLREEEVEELKNSFAKNKMSREFLLKRIDLEQEIEYERIRLVGKGNVELERYEVEAKRKRRELQERLWGDTEAAASTRDIKVEDAKADASVKDLEREVDEKDMELGLKGLQAIKDMKIKQRRDEMDIETERLDRLSKLGIEALITASGEEQGKILADLKKTEMLKDMSEEQILALGAKDSPQLAKAFEEKFKGLSAEKQEQLYKEMIADKDKSTKIMQEMFNKALETQRDVSVAAAQGVTPNVVYPPPGQAAIPFTPVTPVAQAGAEVVICSKCKSKSTPGQKYCNNCGNEMF
jgi:hypothetical protein